ncbi:MAG: hypothetical protein CL938_12005 [Deltaproteobacteria bacterium]|jgi:taurine dioxygenase|nr:hypothetical protein [Deltaproteobacteria bacterium]
MKPAESKALLSFPDTRIASPEFQCRFRWRQNSMVIWDNRCTQHCAVPEDIRAHRRVERVTVIGNDPYWFLRLPGLARRLTEARGTDRTTRGGL